MKKFLVPLFLILLLSCSNEGFKSDIAASAQKNATCFFPDGRCLEISESLCTDIGGTLGKCTQSSSSSNVDDVSSSSGVDDVSSSSVASGVSSSSRGGRSSSSGGDAVSSSSADATTSSSSGDITVSSSSSVAGGVSSSAEGGDASSSSVVVSVSSSSGGTVSSSSSLVVSSSSSAPPSLGACSAFPYYVTKTKKEYIKNLVPSNGCGNVTYSLTGSGSGNNGISITGDTISFANASASSSKRNLTIRATASSQCVNKDCPIEVVITDAAYKDAKCNHQDIFPVNLAITSTTTIIDYACCEPKTDYIITQCGSANFTLSIDGAVAATSKDNSAKLPDLTLIPEPNAKCTEYGGSPGGILYRYPKRMLMTVTNPPLPTGGFSCNSW